MDGRVNFTREDLHDRVSGRIEGNSCANLKLSLVDLWTATNDVAWTSRRFDQNSVFSEDL
jgi:hypothetical protein